jgi:hypothetical protein
LRFRTHSNNIAKVVPAGVIPNLRLRLLLVLLPDPVSIRAQTAMTQIPDIVVQLVD